MAEGGKRGDRGKTEGEMEAERERATGSFSASKPMASSQNVQTLKNSRQRAGREGRCQEWEAGGGEGRARLRFAVRGRAHNSERHLHGRTLTSELW